MKDGRDAMQQLGVSAPWLYWSSSLELASIFSFNVNGVSRQFSSDSLDGRSMNRRLSSVAQRGSTGP